MGVPPMLEGRRGVPPLPSRGVVLALAAALAGCAGPIPREPSHTASRADWVPQVTLARQRESGPLDAAGLMALAEANNPMLAHWAFEVRAAEGRLLQAGLYPNPTLDLGHDNAAPGRDGVRGTSSISLAQPLIVGSRRSAAKSVAALELDEARARYELEQCKLRLSIEETFADLLYQRSSEILARELLEMAEADHALASGGDAPERDAARANVHVSALELDVTKYTAERIFALIKLRRLTGVPDLGPGDVDGELMSSMPRGILDFPTEQTVARHVEARFAALGAAVARAQADAARAERTPDVTVRAGVAYDSRADEGSIGAGLSIPIPIFDRQQGRIAEADAHAAAEGRAEDDVRLRLGLELFEMSQRVTEFDTLAVDYATRIVPAARDAHDRVTRDYAEGRAHFLDVMDAEGAVIAASRQALEYRRQLHLYVARLQYLRGDAHPDGTTAP